MAQGTSPSKGSAKSPGGSARKSTGGSPPGAAAGRRAQSESRGRSAATRRSTSANRSSNSEGAVESVKETVRGGAKSTKDSITSGVQSTGDAVSPVAKKAKGPAIAGAAALAGLAGGLAIASRTGGPRRVLGVPVPGTRRSLITINTPRRVKARSASKDLLKAAGEVGSAGRRVGELVTELQRVRAELDRGRQRSPVELLLEGLTSRRARG